MLAFHDPAPHNLHQAYTAQGIRDASILYSLARRALWLQCYRSANSRSNYLLSVIGLVQAPVFKAAMASGEQAPWRGMRGVKRVTSEFKVHRAVHVCAQAVHQTTSAVVLYHIQTCAVTRAHQLLQQQNLVTRLTAIMCLQYLTNKINNGEWPQVKDLTIVGDDMTRWRFKLCNFDNDMEGGRNLNDDLNVSVQRDQCQAKCLQAGKM